MKKMYNYIRETVIIYKMLPVTTFYKTGSKLVAACKSLILIMLIP